jgi:hypothetical protein
MDSLSATDKKNVIIVLKFQQRSRYSDLWAIVGSQFTILSYAPNWSVIYDRKTFTVQATDATSGWIWTFERSITSQLFNRRCHHKHQILNQVDDDDAAERAFVFDRVMNVADVTLERVTHGKKVAAQETLEPNN